MKLIGMMLAALLCAGSVWSMGVIGTFGALQSLPAIAEESQEVKSQGDFIVQIGAFNNDRGARLLEQKNRERFKDKRIEIHELPSEHGPFRVWLFDFATYHEARKYIEHHAIDGFIIELKEGERVRTKL